MDKDGLKNVFLIAQWGIRFASYTIMLHFIAAIFEKPFLSDKSILYLTIIVLFFLAVCAAIIGKASLSIMGVFDSMEIRFKLHK